ncbi:unnamed protein product [Blepharisma stoltei]|uniref:Uncharacterized protein n=1 Tax=Blepharisma stoltei TaxID=1481888 RepID=A0AAU9IF13_9CILI|nr:unnamed protein product [Blepharisma stoltei]
MELSNKILIALGKTDFRENCLKLIQYISKILHDRLGFTNYSEIALQANILSMNISIARKVLRFGLPLGVMIMLRKRYRLKNFSKIEWSSDIISLIFLFADHLLYFQQIKVIGIPIDSNWTMIVEIVRNLAWLLKSIVTIVSDSIKIHKLQIKIHQVVKLAHRNENSELIYKQAKEDYKQLLIQNNLLVWNFLKSILEIPIPIYYLDQARGYSTLVGILGSFSALIGINQSWKQIHNLNTQLRI